MISVGKASKVWSLVILVAGLGQIVYCSNAEETEMDNTFQKIKDLTPPQQPFWVKWEEM